MGNRTASYAPDAAAGCGLSQKEVQLMLMMLRLCAACEKKEPS